MDWLPAGNCFAGLAVLSGPTIMVMDGSLYGFKKGQVTWGLNAYCAGRSTANTRFETAFVYVVTEYGIFNCTLTFNGLNKGVGGNCNTPVYELNIQTEVPCDVPPAHVHSLLPACCPCTCFLHKTRPVRWSKLFTSQGCHSLPTARAVRGGAFRTGGRDRAGVSCGTIGIHWLERTRSCACAANGTCLRR